MLLMLSVVAEGRLSGCRWVWGWTQRRVGRSMGHPGGRSGWQLIATVAGWVLTAVVSIDGRHQCGQIIATGVAPLLRLELLLLLQLLQQLLLLLLVRHRWMLLLHVAVAAAVAATVAAVAVAAGRRLLAVQLVAAQRHDCRVGNTLTLSLSRDFGCSANWRLARPCAWLFLGFLRFSPPLHSSCVTFSRVSLFFRRLNCCN